MLSLNLLEVNLADIQDLLHALNRFIRAHSAQVRAQRLCTRAPSAKKSNYSKLYLAGMAI